MKKNIAKTAEDLVTEKLSHEGFDLWDVRYEKDAGVWNLVFEVEKRLLSPGAKGMTMADCECANRIVEPIIENADLIDEPYTLEVSSAGLTRLLRTETHFERALKEGWNTHIKLFAPQDGVREFRGALSFAAKTEVGIGGVQIKKKNIARAVALLC